MKQFLATLVFFVSLGFLTGCVSRGTDFNYNDDWLRNSKPTMEQVKNTMGEPYKIGSADGVATWTYGFYRHELFGESHTKELKIYWHGDGKLKTYSFSSSFPKDKYHLRK